MTTRAGRSLLPALGGLVALYLSVPLVAFIVRLARSSAPGFHTPGLWSAAGTSVIAATISLGVMCLFGIPLAYALARSDGRIAKVVGIAVAVPLALPPLMGGILLVYLVGPYSWAGRLFGGHLTESLTGIVLAQTFVAAPFLITVARAALTEVDPALYDVAETLGIGPMGQFVRVAIPAARRGIRAGMVLAWLRAFGEYGATIILAYHPYSLPVFTYLQFGGAGLTNTEAPTAIAIVVAAGAVALGEIQLPRLRRRTLPLPTASAPALRAPSTIAFDLDLRLGSFHLDLAYRSRTGRLAILGPSGSGKSVTLRCLAGVLEPDHGSVEIGGGSDVSDRSGTTIGYVPQTLGLFPQLRVGEQILFGRGTDPERAAFWVDRLGIDDLLDRSPEALSGGERQRVSLARTFARDPDLLLLDEPFSALDAPVRAGLRLELRALQRACGVPSVVVTHDPEEASMLAEEILVIADGRLLQAGSVREIFDNPASPAVARLLGVENIFSGTATAASRVTSFGVVVDTTSGELDTEVIWAFRAAAATIDDRGLSGVVVDVIDKGAATDALVELAPGLIVQLRCTESLPSIGHSVGVRIPPAAITVWRTSPAAKES